MPLKNFSGNGEQYRKTPRYWRRMQARQFLAAGGFGAVPPVLGQRTILLCLVARHGPVALQELLLVSPVTIVTGLLQNDEAGVLVGWKLVNCGAVDLNRKFPLHRELREFLLAFGSAHGIRIEPEPPSAGRRRRVPRSVDLDHLCYSVRKTQLLAALEMHDGEVRRRTLESTIPGYSRNDLRQPLKGLIADGILAGYGEKVTFRDEPWTPAFRELLRAWLRYKPEFVRARRARITEYENARSIGRTNGILGRAATQRILEALAIHGPMTQPRLFERAIHDEACALPNFLRDRIVVRDERAGVMTLGLNADHPAYAEIRELALALAGKPPAPERAPDPHGGAEGCDVAHLFGTPAQLDMLAALAAYPTGEMDASAFLRFFPEYIYQTFLRRLPIMVGWGVLRKRKVTAMFLYRFDGNYTHHEALMALLERVLEMRPRYRAVAELDHRMQSPRRRTLEKHVVATRPRGVKRIVKNA